jgi:hypothetical protein
MARTQETWGKSSGIAGYIGIANLFRTLDAKAVRKALALSGKETKRQRDLPAEAVVYFVIAMALYMHVNLREVLFCLMEGLRMIRGLDVKIAGKSGISQARTRIGAEPLRHLYEEQVRPIATKSSKGAWYKRWRLISIDGSTLDIPDEVGNREIYGGPTTYNGPCAFPQIRFVCPAEIGTRVLFSGKMAGYGTSEIALAKEIIGNLKPDMLCIADRGFFSRGLWRQARETGADLLWRVRSDIKLPVMTELADGSYLSNLSSYRADRKKDAPIPVRVVEYSLKQNSGQENMVYRIATSILDPQEAPADDIARLYHERWEIETAFDELKTHLRGSRLCLRSKTPELVEQEFYGLLLAHFTVRGLMHEASRKADIDPDALSFTHSLRVIRRKRPLIPAFPP